MFIPPLDTGYWNGNVRTFNLNMQDGNTQFLPGLITPTSGYNGSYLGPTLYIRKQDNVALNVSNSMTEVTTTHWHGLHIPAYLAASKAMETTYGKKPVPVKSGGSIPIVALFEAELGVKSILLGFGLDSDAIHSPNEHYGIFNYLKGIETIPHFFANYAKAH